MFSDDALIIPQGNNNTYLSIILLVSSLELVKRKLVDTL